MEIRGIVTTTVMILALIVISTASAEPICWTANTSWDAPEVGWYETPALADLDCDGDYDLLIGASDGKSYGYENTGNASSPNWTENTGWDAPDVGYQAAPAFADMDCDGDYDLLIGVAHGVCYGYENLPCTPPDTTPPVITITTPEPYGLYTVGMTLDFTATDDGVVLPPSLAT